MGAVKRTHKNLRERQQYRKYINRTCDRDGIRPRTEKALMDSVFPKPDPEMLELVGRVMSRIMGPVGMFGSFLSAFGGDVYA